MAITVAAAFGTMAAGLLVTEPSGAIDVAAGGDMVTRVGTRPGAGRMAVRHVLPDVGSDQRLLRDRRPRPPALLVGRRVVLE
ncbi:hypothetical protein ACPXCX_47050, partial [Streptomyces sp. DT225]